MMKLVLVAVAAIVTAAMALPVQHSEAVEGTPLRIVRAADPDPGHHHHFHRGNRGFGGLFSFGGYDNGGYGYGGYGHGGYGHGGYGHGGYGHGGYGHGGYGHGGYEHGGFRPSGFGLSGYGLGNYGHGGYGNGGYGHGGYGHGGYGSGYNNYYPHSGPNSQSIASAASINTPFGSASYASANSAGNSGGIFGLGR